MCTRAVSGLAHYFERAGIPTVVLALVPHHAESIKPPRTLFLPFELGRPLGVPDDAEFQHRVLTAALGLLDQTQSPVMVQFEEDVPPGDQVVEEGWSCPVNFTGAKSEEGKSRQVMNEIRLLRPWYEKVRSGHNPTTVGVSELALEEVVTFLVQFLDDDMPLQSPIDKYSLADALKYAAEDLKAFYNESAVNQPGSITALEAENWYWNHTSAGALVREVKMACGNHPDESVKIVGGFTLVPHTQQ